MASVIFSLEMSREEITKRMLVCRVRREAHQAHQGPHGPQRLGAARRNGRARREGAAVHRRQPQHVAHGDPRQVPPPQAAARPQARGDRLPAAHELRHEGRVAPARGLASSRARSSCSPRRSTSPSSRSRSSTVAPSSAATRSPCSPTCVSPAQSSKTPTS